VIGQVDFWHHDGSEPRYRHRKALRDDGTADEAMQAELNSYLRTWLGFLIAYGFRVRRRPR
jgi:hypothetical protein